MRHRGPPLLCILKLIHRRICPRALTTHILFNGPRTITPAIKIMLSLQQLDKFVEVRIVDQRACVASRFGSDLAARVVLFAGRGIVEDDVAGRADDAGVAGVAGGEEGL